VTTTPDRRFLISGALMLAVAMGVGRFAYTPLLPVMERDAGLSVAAAGTLAFSNLLGYLVGAMLAMLPFTHRRRLVFARWAIAGVVVTTGLMAAPSSFWLPMRFLAGVSSGFVLIFASSIVLERAAHRNHPAWPPLFFSGVGLGIAFSALAVPFFVALGGSRGAWIGVAGCSAAATLLTLRWFVDDGPAATLVPSPIGQHLPTHRATFVWLAVVYTGEAFAYIIPATFLVAIVSQVPGLGRFATLTWLLVGMSAALATFPWILAGARLGKARALALALGIQAFGILALILWHSALAAIIAAVTLGGTFTAITLFVAGLARDIFPHRTSAAVSRLTVLYSVGQMLGPLIATQLALHFGSYGSALLCAATTAAFAAVTTLFVIHDPRLENGSARWALNGVAARRN
jgi:predicted MFS family arabinose efflux permease